MSKILIIEDDSDINKILSVILERQGCDTVQAYSGSEAMLRLFPTGEFSGDYNLIILDLMLPGLSGDEIIRKIRAYSEVPVIVISAKTALEDKVALLNLGADDYVTKPFEKEEVIARVNRALARYSKPVEKSEESELTYLKLTINPAGREVMVDGNILSLTVHEYEILYLLMKNQGKVYSKDSIYELVWQNGYYGEDNTVNVHVSNIRKKIAAYDSDEYIKTVWGIGFKIG